MITALILPRRKNRYVLSLALRIRRRSHDCPPAAVRAQPDRSYVDRDNLRKPP